MSKATNDCQKYKMVLKLVNSMLTNIGRPEITDLTEFKDIDRDDILCDLNKTTVLEMENELFPLFDKKKVGYYRQNCKGFVVNCIRGLLKDIGYKLSYVHRDMTSTVNGKNYRRTHTIYSIL